MISNKLNEAVDNINEVANRFSGLVDRSSKEIRRVDASRAGDIGRLARELSRILEDYETDQNRIAEEFRKASIVR